MKIPESIQRRDFIKQLGLASTAALATNGSQAWGSEEIIHPAAKADSCILIWMAGGMAAPDTFDPKRYFPLRKVWKGKNPQHLSCDRYQCGWLANQRRIGKYCTGYGSWNIDPFSSPTGSRINSPLPPPVPLAHGLCSSDHRCRSTSGYGWPKCLAQRTRSFLPSSISASDSKESGKRGT